MKHFLIAGNWKMNKTISETAYLINAIKKDLNNNINTNILICPPFTSLETANNEIGDSNILLGAQNCHFAENGAFTGEISVSMLKATGCSYIIVGHSERRQLFNESNSLINQKLKAILSSGLCPILCIGETPEERENGTTNSVLTKQLTECLKDITKCTAEKIVIAYEPVWAIGTGKTATPDQIAETHAFIRNKVAELINSNAQIPLLYGGSVNEKNATEILSVKDVDGALIGGASLVAEKFLTIINTANQLSEKL